MAPVTQNRQLKHNLFLASESKPLSGRVIQQGEETTQNLVPIPDKSIRDLGPIATSLEGPSLLSTMPQLTCMSPYAHSVLIICNCVMIIIFPKVFCLELY